MPPAAPPVVSVIIATYNWSAALRCAIRSVLLQDFPDYELLVIGDRCTDDTEAVVRSFGDPRIKWHNLPENHGSQYGPNNFGLRIACGEYVAYLGHDDLWWPGHLRSCLDRIRETDADLVAGVTILYGPPESGVRGVTGIFVENEFSPSQFFVPSSLLHKRNVMDRVGPWKKPEEIELPVDVEFISRCHEAGLRIAATNEVTCFKFPAAWRRNSYRAKLVGEQEEFLCRIKRGNDFRQAELVEVLRSVVEQRFSRVAAPLKERLTPGEIHRANLRTKGVAAADPSSLVLIGDETRRFPLGVEFDCFEWHPPQCHDRYGLFRWTGPGTRSTFQLPIQFDRPLQLKVHIPFVVHQRALASLKLAIGSENLPVKIRRTNIGTFTATAVARPQPGLVSDAGLHVTIEIDKTRRPYDLGAGEDRRWLGLAVNWIEVAPVTDGAAATDTALNAPADAEPPQPKLERNVP